MNLKSFGRIPKKPLIVVYTVVIAVFIYLNWFVRVYSTQRPNKFEPKGLSRKILIENVKKNTKVSFFKTLVA